MNNIFKKGIIAALAISTVVLASGCSKKDTKLAEIKEKKTLVVGTSADYPPYEFIDMTNGKDEIVGFDIDIAKEIAKDLGVEVEIRNLDFDGLLPALSSGKVDIVISGMTPDEKRKQSADFSKLYYTATHGIIMRKDEASSVNSFEDLNGKVVGVQQSTIQATMAKEKIKSPKEIKEVGKITDLVLMLQTKKVDAIIMEKPVAEAYVKTNSDLALTSVEVTDEDGGSAVAVKKDNPSLVAEINKTIDRLAKDNKINEFFDVANKLAEQQAQ